MFGFSSSAATLRSRALSLDGLYVLVALALVALRPLLTPVPPYDFWWHLAEGRTIVRVGGVPEVDTFSFTQAGQPFFNQSWLAQVLLYALHQLGGVALIIALQALVIALAYALLLALVVRRSGRLRLSVVLLLLGVVPISFDNWIVRPQSYALPIFAAYLLVLTAYRRGWWRRLWLLPLLMLLWVNLHGSFVLGLALIGLVLLGEGLRRLAGQQEALDWAAWRRLALWGVLTGLATLANPRGLEVLSYVRNLLSSPAVTELVTEWASPTTRSLSGKLFFLFLIGLFLALIYARQRPELTDLVLLLPFLWLALGAVRNIIWFAMVALPLLVDALASRGRPARRAFQGSPAINGLLAGLLLLGVLLALPWFKPALGLPPKLGALVSTETPMAAVRALRELPAGQRPARLYHAEGFGSYLIWAAPEQPVFIDPRIELYPYQQWVDSIDLSQGDQIEELLALYQFDGMLLSPELQAPLVDWARQSQSWRVVYQDDVAVLLIKQ